MNERYEKFTLNIAQIYFNIQRIKADEMKEYGLTARHVNCLYFLYQHDDGVSINQMVQEMGEDKAAVSRALQALKEKGLVSQEDGGTRKYKNRLFLTEEGRRVAGGTERKIAAAVDYTGKDLTEEERSQFYDTLSLIDANLSEYMHNLRARTRKSED